MGQKTPISNPAILGAGAWGTALALVLARRGMPVRLWVHHPAHAAEMALSRTNESYLPGIALPGCLQISPELEHSVRGADAVIFAVPSHALRSIAAEVRPYLARNCRLVSATKGIEEGGLKRMSQILEEVCEIRHTVALSGPSFAREVAEQKPTALVAASASLSLAQDLQQLFSGPEFRVYASPDLCGVELGGAVKNVIAIAAGVCHGLSVGDNAIAALITRGLAEMSRLGSALGAQPQTFAGLAGLGDLVLTCTGKLSRNRQVGIHLAEGFSLQHITSHMKTVAEGIRTTNSVVELGRRENVNLPISEQMHAVLHGYRTPLDALRILMDRSPGGE